MTKGHANRIFILMNAVSLICAVIDVWMEFVVNPVPLSQGEVVLGTALSLTYKIMRNACIVIYFIYVFTVTRTEYRLQSLKSRLFLWLPNSAMVLLLLQNLFTHNVFVVTAEGGYARGPLLPLVYAIAFLYMATGVLYCIYSRRYLIPSKWTALVSVYLLTFASVLIQMLRPELLLELFSTCVGTLIVLLLIMRPEETIDGTVVVQGWKAYQRDLNGLLRSGQHVQVVVVQITNAREIRSYLGDVDFREYIMELAAEIDRLYYELHVHIDLYFERPGSFYLVLEDTDLDVAGMMPKFVEGTLQRIKRYAEQGVRFEPKFCVIKCPDVIGDIQEIIDIGHSFTQFIPHERMVVEASEIVGMRDYAVVNHMKEILNRAITEGTLEMYYQPIYALRARQFISAEALARVKDPEYGMISPALFIPAAEKAGLIIPLGNLILESVYRFISENDLCRLGLSTVEINLSVAQCIQPDLPATVRRLQETYHVRPEQINFEITETLFENLSEVMDRNLRELEQLGYTFSLDDYGIGYSNIHRLSKLPLEIIKIDKSLVDEMFTDSGQVILKNTISMMRGIHKKLVVEGVETKEQLEALAAMSCNYIQGFYYSRPLPEGDFIEFLEKYNRPADEAARA